MSKVNNLAPLPDLTEYDDPVLYDMENQGIEPWFSFYHQLAQQFEGEVLEIGCGTGRYTIPLAQAGVSITGLDVMGSMLAVAKEGAADLPIEWVEADAREFAIDKQFSLIFTSGATFMHLLTTRDQLAFLNCVARHLGENGRFLLELMLPTTQLQQNETESEWFSYETSDGRAVTVSGIVEYDPISQIRIETAYRRWEEDGQTVTKTAPLSLRNTFPQELELLLHRSGFVVEARYGSPKFDPLTETSTGMLYLCKRERGRE